MLVFVDFVIHNFLFFFQTTVPVDGCRMGPNATNTLKLRQLAVKQKQDVKQRVAILFQFTLLKKTSLFINSACAPRRTSGLDRMTRTPTGLGSGRTPLPGPTPIGPVLSIPVTGGCRTVVICSLWMENLVAGSSPGENGTLSCVICNTTLSVNNLCLPGQDLNLAI